MMLYRRTHFGPSRLLQLGQAPAASLVAAIFPTRRTTKMWSMRPDWRSSAAKALWPASLNFSALCFRGTLYPLFATGTSDPTELPSSEGPSLSPSSDTQDEASLALSTPAAREQNPKWGSKWHHSLSEPQYSARRIPKDASPVGKRIDGEE